MNMISWIFYNFFNEAIALHFLEHIEDVLCFTCKFALIWFPSANCFVDQYFTRTSLKAKSQCFDNETFRSKSPVLKVEMEARRCNLSNLRIADMQIR